MELAGSPVAPSAADSPQAGREEAEKPRLRDLLRLSVGSHLVALPAQVAMALRACEAAPDATARKEYDAESVQGGVAVIRELAGRSRRGGAPGLARGDR